MQRRAPTVKRCARHATLRARIERVLLGLVRGGHQTATALLTAFCQEGHGARLSYVGNLFPLPVLGGIVAPVNGWRILTTRKRSSSSVTDWLLSASQPWVRLGTLISLLDRPAGSAEVRVARRESVHRMLRHAGAPSD